MQEDTFVVGAEGIDTAAITYRELAICKAQVTKMKLNVIFPIRFCYLNINGFFKTFNRIP